MDFCLYGRKDKHFHVSAGFYKQWTFLAQQRKVGSGSFCKFLFNYVLALQRLVRCTL